MSQIAAPPLHYQAYFVTMPSPLDALLKELFRPGR